CLPTTICIFARGFISKDGLVSGELFKKTLVDSSSLRLRSGTRISVGQIDYLSRSGAINTNNLDLHVDANEKATLQNLNDRLASYLEKVHKLEKENERLEKQIAEWYTSKTVISHDYSAYMATIEDLQNKIREATMVNIRTYLEIDNSKLAADDFKMKYETELSMRQAVEADIAGLKRVLDDLTMCKMDLESQQETLKEELIMLKRNHEEVKLQRKQRVNVEVDAGSQVDLNRIMTEIREHYEALIAKNRKDLEQWHQSKPHLFLVTFSLHSVYLPMQLNQTMKKTKQTFFLLPQQKSSLEASLLETQQRYAAQLSGLQDVVTGLEAQLSSLSENIRENELKYSNLLDIKTRLELEISEYRRLLDGEDVSIWYSWLCRSMSARSCVSCVSRDVTCIWSPWSFIEYRDSVSANVPSRPAF
uniref:Keratin 98 n=1 Tax=Xiphophorus maculatus TaxID=8083 RepID=A0A3B5QI23_XIPMA